jgi:hypothetical protein
MAMGVQLKLRAKPNPPDVILADPGVGVSPLDCPERERKQKRRFQKVAEQAAEKLFQAVILSPFSRRGGIRVNSAKNLALSTLKTMRDPSSSANKNGGLLRMTASRRFPAACEVPAGVACSSSSSIV